MTAGQQLDVDALTRFPHCDARILHAPGTCEYCDQVPEWQLLRRAWGIAFTGCVPAVHGDRCGKRFKDPYNKGKLGICMQGAGHGPDIPCSSSEPWEAMPCPADNAVMTNQRGNYDAWAGNRPRNPSPADADTEPFRALPLPEGSEGA